MNDEEIVTALRGEARRLTAVELAELLDQLTGGGLSQSALVTYFKRALPSLPLRILLESGAWTQVSGGDLSDDQFNELLRPWMGR